MRKPLVIANWKMHGSRPWVSAYLGKLKQALVEEERVEIVICPPLVFLSQVAEQLAKSHLAWGAQDISRWEAGAHTGDVSGDMLKEAGCHYVLVGHSERRADHREGNEEVAQKYAHALAAGLQPVLCVGETQSERAAGNTLKVVAAQMDVVLEAQQQTTTPCIIAYEPVWAIGTGLTATAAQAQEVHAFIRQQLRQRLGLSRAEVSLVLYGGSVKADNAKALFSQPDIDGGLIGGASLEVENFIEICKSAIKQAEG